MAKFKIVSAIVSCLSLLFLVGCWDSVELEDRAFTYAVAIDLAEENSDGTQLTLTTQLIVPSGIGTSTSEAAGGEPAFRNVSYSGESIMNVNREISTRLSRIISSQHLKVILISQQVAEQPKLFGKVLDVYLREREMKRGMKVAIVDGDASQLLDVKPEHVRVPGEYIELVLDNQSNAGTIESIRIGEIQGYLLSDLNFNIPKLKYIDDRMIEYDGVAVYNSKTNQLGGVLSREETKGLNFINNNPPKGTLVIKVQDHKAVIENLKMKHRLTADIKDKQNINFYIDLSINGAIVESYDSLDLTNQSTLQDFQQAYQKTIKEKIERVIEKSQRDLETDAFKLDAYLRGNHYKFWETVKEDWDTGENYFSNSKINVNVQAVIEHPGTSNLTQEKKGD